MLQLGIKLKSNNELINTWYVVIFGTYQLKDYV